MFKRVQNRITQALSQQTFRSDDELYLYLVSFVAAVFCMAVHVILLVLFTAWDYRPYALINTGSIAVYCLAFYLITKGRYLAVGLLISSEVTLYALLGCYLLGAHNHITGYFLLVIIMQVIIPYGHIRLRAAMTALALLCTAAGLFIGYTLPAAWPMSIAKNNTFTLLNIAILFIGTLAQLYIGDVLRSMIAHINGLRMEDLQRDAYTDPLTGLYNRRYAALYFQKLAGISRNYCVAMLDIDDFKNVNDTYGHASGDRVLSFLADFMKSTLRKSDEVFRWGGEEFLLALTDVDCTAAHALLDKLRKRLEETDIPILDGQSVRITVTIGVAALNPAESSGCIDLSDQRLYAGKRAGKNRVVSSADLPQDAPGS